jgi:hypothetical protein
MHDRQEPDEHSGAVQRSPSAHADPAAQVEGGRGQGRQVAGDDAGPGKGRPIAQGERDDDPSPTGLQPLVPEQRQTVDGDSGERCERHVFVQPGAGAPTSRFANRLGGHRQPKQHRS